MLSGLVLAIGAAFVLPTARSLISGMVSPSEQGVVLSSLASLTGLASAIGPVAAGWIYDTSQVGCFVFEASAGLLGLALLKGEQVNHSPTASGSGTSPSETPIQDHQT